MTTLNLIIEGEPCDVPAGISVAAV
ncbi:(2Fe-2S)-binding protein, partial [Enterobacter sp. 63]